MRTTWVKCIIFGAASLSSPAWAQNLGTASSFAVLGGSTVTNTGPSMVNGDLGVSPGSALTGFPPGVVAGGTIHLADAVALQAQSDLATAYNFLAGQPCGINLTGQDLGGLTLTPAVYCFSSSAQLTGALVLNGPGTYIFQIGTSLTTASGSSVSFINGASACNLWWQTGASATLSSATAFAGNILALASISVNIGANVSGRVLARNGAVTLDTNVISLPICVVTPTPTVTALPATPTPGGPTATPGAGTATPVPGTPTPLPGTPTPGGPAPSPTPPVIGVVPTLSGSGAFILIALLAGVGLGTMMWRS